MIKSRMGCKINIQKETNKIKRKLLFLVEAPKKASINLLSLESINKILY